MNSSISISLVSKTGIAVCAIHPRDCRTAAKCDFSLSISTSLCTPWTLYKTESDMRPSSVVIDARACTAYFACLRLPSTQNLSSIRMGWGTTESYAYKNSLGNKDRHRTGSTASDLQERRTDKASTLAQNMHSKRDQHTDLSRSLSATSLILSTSIEDKARHATSQSTATTCLRTFSS
nr:hypothetical protein Iba_chr10eCG10860 [Ipomoea batatas]